jgi:3-O-methylgallate 3,4-dioxygenase
VAEVVVAFGTSHSPMLNATVEEWGRFEAREPGMSLLDREGSPASYESLVRQAGGRYAGEYAPEKLAARHAAAQAALDRLSAEIREARLDALLIIGDDQKELFLEDNLPGVLVYCGKSLPHRMRPAKPGWVDWFAAIQSRYYLENGNVEFPVAHELARHLVAAMVEREFDVSTCDRLPRGEGVGHAFAFVHQRLFRFGRAAPIVPVVPVFLNTYYPPNQPTPARCYRLGRALRAAVESYPKPARVGVIASGGLSHFAIDEALDGEVVGALKARDGERLMRIPPRKLNSGSSEIRNWIAMAGAAEHLPMAWSEYIPGYRSPAGTGTGLCFAALRQ